MKHPLLRQFDTLKRLVQRVAWEDALFQMFLRMAIFFLLATALDVGIYGLWQGNWPEARILIEIGFGAMVLGQAWRHAQVFQTVPRSRLELLARLQQNDAEGMLPPTLDSAIAFLQDENHSQESSELREEVVRQGMRAFEKVRGANLLEKPAERRNRWRRRAWVVLVLVLLSSAAAITPRNARIALRRFFTPWNAPVWHWDVDITWKTLPHKLLRGEDFQAECHVPRRLRWINVAIWKPDTPLESPEVYRIRPTDGRFLVRIPQVQTMFRIVPFREGQVPNAQRAARIQVQTPPELNRAQIYLVPPKYTGRKPYFGDWNIRDLAGTKIGFLLTADRPLQEARVCFHNETYVPGEVYQGDARQFLFRFELLGDMAYHLELTDTQGCRATLETWNIERLDDQAPFVAWTQPEDGRPILPGAKIRLVVRGRDDYGLTALGYRWLADSPNVTTGHRSPRWTTFTLWNSAGQTSVSTQETSFTWDLSPLQLSVGERVRLEALAEDADLAQGVSERVTLRVVSEAEMAQQILPQWLTVTRELRHLEQTVAQVAQAETHEAQEAPMAVALRMTDPRYPDCFFQALTALRRDLDENPSFALTERLGSLELRATAEELDQILQEITRRWLPELRRAVYRRGASSASEIQAAVDEILKRIQPFLQDWTEREAAQRLAEKLETLADGMRIESEMPFWTWAERYGVPVATWGASQRSAWETLQIDASTLREAFGTFFATYRETFPDMDTAAVETSLLASALWQTAALSELDFAKMLDARLEMRTQLGTFVTSDAGKKLFPSDVARLAWVLRMHENQQTLCEAFPDPKDANASQIWGYLGRLQSILAHELTTFPMETLPRTVPLVLQTIVARYVESAERFPTLTGETATAQHTAQKELTQALFALRQVLERTPDIAVSERDAEMENKVTPKETTSPKKAEEPPHVVDIQIMLTSQETILQATETLQKNSDDVARATGALELKKQEEAVLAMAEALGFRTNESGKFADILAHIHQVIFLFSQNELSEMNIGLQKEILYGLRATLRKDETDTSASNADEEKDGEKDPNLSGSTDSESETTPEENASNTSSKPQAEPFVEPTLPELQRGIWGELPPRIQEELQTAPTEQILPAYRKTIEAYYQFLRSGKRQAGTHR